MWYDYSWKGDIDKSGGVLFNIGIHFFDMLIWIFGEPVIDNVQISNKKALGTLNFKNAEVEFYLSIDYNDLPHKEWKAFRSLNINDKDYDFSEGFTELHNISYEKIINGEGFGINDIFPAIELIEKMNSK